MSGGVPPGSRAYRRPTRVASKSAQVRRAASLYERFTGHDPEALGRVTVKPLPKAAAVIGECDGLLYTTVRDGVKEKYIHQFKPNDKPLLCVTPDGTQILLVGGAYDFTERGIVDRSDPTSHRRRR